MTVWSEQVLTAWSIVSPCTKPFTVSSCGLSVLRVHHTFLARVADPESSIRPQ